MRVAEDHTAELDAMVAELSAAGVLEEFVDEDGRPSLRLTPQGAAVGRRLAMTGDEDEAQAVIDALLAEGRDKQERRTYGSGRI